MTQILFDALIFIWLCLYVAFWASLLLPRLRKRA